MPDYFESGVFTQNRPAWHGAGIVVPDEVLTVEKVFDLVPTLASPVIKMPVLANLGDRLIEVPDKYATIRMLDEKPLGVVGSRYKVLQNKDAFQFVADIVDSGEASIVTAGTLRGGATIWFLCKLPGSVRISGLDSETMETYILISNSHDGSSAIRVAIVHVRVVCANTLAAAFGSVKDGHKFSIRHTDSIEGNLMEARTALGLAFKSQEGMVETAERLLDVTITDEDIAKWLDGFLPVPEDEKAKNRKLVEKHRAGIVNALETTPNLTYIKGTAWGLVQATSQYADHRTFTRKSGVHSAAENRFRAAVSGSNLTSRSLVTAADLFLTAA